MPYIPTQADNDELRDIYNQNSPNAASINSGISPVTNTAQTPNSSGFSSSIPGSGFGQYVINNTLGFGDALRNTLAAGANGLSRLEGVPLNIPMAHSAQGTAYNLGDIGGNIAGFMGGGEGVDTLRLASEGAPYLGKVAQMLGGQSWLPTATRQALGSAAYGGIATNDNRLGNAGLGAGMALAGSALPPVAQLGVKGAQYLMPQRYLNQMLDQLGGGQTLQGATQSVLGAIQNAYKTAKEDSSDLYNPIFNNLANRPLYAQIKTPDPFMSTDAQAGYSGYFKPSQTSAIDSGYDGLYPQLSQSVFDNYSNPIKGLHNDFMANPTFQGAHDLQSAIGQDLNSLYSNPQKTKDVRNEIDALSTARTSLQSDMSNFLRNQQPPNVIQNPDVPSLEQQYINAGKDFQANVAPYRNNPDIFSIASGETTNLPPVALANIFKAPDANMLKVVSDLPPGTMDKVLYTQLGKDTPSSNPITFLRTADRLDEQGLGDYLSPDLQAQINSLRNRVKLKTLAQSASSGALGAMEGAHHGVGPALGLGFTAATLGSPFMNYLSRRLPLEEIGNAISTGVQKMYGPVRTGLLANTLNKTGDQQ